MKCDKIQPLLSEFVDNALSARDTWEVDRHLTECPECQRRLNELKQTIRLLHAAPSFEVSEYFEANLEARLAKMQPKPYRLFWLQGLREIFRPRMLPAWVATSAVGVILILFMITSQKPMQTANKVSAPSAESSIVQQARVQNMALTAVNPLEDISIANLSAHPSGQYDSSSGKIE